MKKLLVSVCSLAGAAAFAVVAPSVDVITFSTPGTDTYADGTPVADGECYALVWSSDGVFDGLNADGSLVDTNDKLMLVAPVAKGGCCPSIVFQVPAQTGGKYDVYVLDTRLASGKVGGVTEKGTPVAVNSSGKVSSASISVSGTVSTVAAATGAASASVVAPVPADAPQPKIKSMELKGGYAYITVENTASYLQYKAVKSDTPDFAGETEASAPEQGKGAADGVVTLVVPASGATGFFKVNRN